MSHLDIEETGEAIFQDTTRLIQESKLLIGPSIDALTIAVGLSLAFIEMHARHASGHQLQEIDIDHHLAEMKAAYQHYRGKVGLLQTILERGDNG